jgi:hypothetical protein
MVRDLSLQHHGDAPIDLPANVIGSDMLDVLSVAELARPSSGGKLASGVRRPAVGIDENGDLFDFRDKLQRRRHFVPKRGESVEEGFYRLLPRHVGRPVVTAVRPPPS